MANQLNGMFTMLRKIYQEQKKQTKLLTEIRDEVSKQPEELFMTKDEHERQMAITAKRVQTRMARHLVNRNGH